MARVCFLPGRRSIFWDNFVLGSNTTITRAMSLKMASFQVSEFVKLAIFKDMALVIVVLLPRTKLSQKMDLRPGRKQTLAIYGTRANVQIKPPHVSTGTSVSCAMLHITRV